MTKLPTPELISSVTDVNDLRNACLALLRVAEKERESKKKYRSSATLLKQELDAVKLELQCLEEKNQALVECIQNSSNNPNDPNIKSILESQNENAFLNTNNDELQNKIKSLEAQIEELKKQQELNINKINTLQSSNLSLEQEKGILESNNKKSETTIDSLNQQLQSLQASNISLTSEKETCDMKIKNYEEKVTLLQAHLTQLKKTSQTDSNLEEQLTSLTDENAKLLTKVSEIENLQIENIELKEKHKLELAKLTEENQTLKQRVEQIETQSKLNEISIKTAQLESKSDLEHLQQENLTIKEENEKLKALNEEYEQKINEYEIANFQLSNDQKALVSITENNKNVAKERIKKLKQTNQQLEESHKVEMETLTAEKDQKIQELRNQIQELQDEKNSLIEQHKEKVNKMRTQKTNLKTKVETLKQENDKLKLNLSDLEVSLHDTNAQNEVMIQRISEFEKSKNNNISLEKTNSSLNSTIQKMNIEMFELKEKVKSDEDLQAAVNDREKTIAKLKEQIQAFIKNDKEKSEKINKLQDEICEMTNKIGVLSSSQGNLNTIDQLAKVEREKADLEKKIQNSEASIQMMKKNQKLNDIIEKSNKLYIQLKDENEQLKKQLSLFKRKIQLNSTFLVICDILETNNNIERNANKLMTKQVNFEDGQNISPDELKLKRKKKKEEKKLAQTAYLRRVLLQFFTEEEKNRPSLIPIILKLVGCNDDQVSAVVRQWERSNTLFSGLFGF